MSGGAHGWFGFDPDGMTLRVVRGDGSATALVVDPASWLRIACQVANRDLTEREWATIHPGTPLTSTCAALR